MRKGAYMNIRVRRYRAMAAATAAALCSVAVVAAAAPAEAATVKTVRVRMTDSAITFHGGGAMAMNGSTMLPAGRYHFHVVAPDGAHSLQLLRFQNGYTPDQAQQDFVTAFEGDVAAVQRIDNGVLFLGGASARPHNPGDMVARVRAGQVAALDVNGSAMGLLQVTGSGAADAPSHDGKYTAFSFGWGVSKHLPAVGTVKLSNQADQPHFLVLQRVKDGTTTKQVRKFINSGAQGNPSWALKASADTGVLSPGKSQLISYELPPGKYFIACFWPDYFTGAPHFLMGMWKLVTLS
jgi:hypothetical protein